MYRPDERLFIFTLRRVGSQTRAEGLSPRYTAITLLGLAAESPATTNIVLHGQSLSDVGDRLATDVAGYENVGDVALTLWALLAIKHSRADAALKRLVRLNPAEGTLPVVELAWSLSALATADDPETTDLTARVRARLLAAFNPGAGVFPHVVGPQSRLRKHVACFADQVYPIQALSLLASRRVDRAALDAASTCAKRICDAQGAEGQWWWHYDSRTGAVLEGYPVYAVHQDSMAPMALLALKSAGGPDHSLAMSRGFSWLSASPELNGGSLIDTDAGLIWRKVARREPGRISRYVQAAAAAIHPEFRIGGIERVFPPAAIDFEDRPYHLGWLLLTDQLLRQTGS
jgi:hypothetical protein